MPTSKQPTPVVPAGPPVAEPGLGGFVGALDAAFAPAQAGGCCGAPVTAASHPEAGITQPDAGCCGTTTSATTTPAGQAVPVAVSACCGQPVDAQGGCC